MGDKAMTTQDSKDWRWIPGYENLYGVTRDGRVWSAKKRTHAGCWRKQTIMWSGYSTVSLSKDGKSHTHMVHRLVAMTYIPNPNNLPQVNHMNGIKTDNVVTNLEWCTQAENQQHSRRTGLYKNQATGERHGSAKLTVEQVAEIKRLLPTVGNRYIARDFGVHEATISSIRRGLTWRMVDAA